MRTYCVCENEEETGGGGFGFVSFKSFNFLLFSKSDRTTSQPSRDSTPESPAHSELCKRVWASLSLASNFGFPRPASMFATPSW